MSLKKIQFKVYADKTINRIVPYTIKQGEINEYNIVLDPTLLIPAGSGYTCYIKFKRPNNTKSGDILMTYNNNGLYSYVIKDDWVLNCQGKLSITFEARRTVNNEVTSILLGNTFLYVSPNADYTEYAALPPDNITILNERIDSEVSTLNDKIDANYDDLSVNKLNRNFTTYEELDWENLQPTDKLVINRPITNELNESDVEVYYADVDDLYNSVNGVDADSTGNISIDGNDIPYDSNDSITDKINSLQEQVTSNDSDIADLDTNKVNKSDPVTYYAYEGEAGSRRAVDLKDKDSNLVYPRTKASITYLDDDTSVQAAIDNIKLIQNKNKGYYATGEALLEAYPNNIADPTERTGWWAVVGNTDTIWIWDVEGNAWVNSFNKASDVTSVNGLTGDVTLNGANIYANPTVDDVVVNKLINAHLTDLYDANIDRANEIDALETRATNLENRATTIEGNVSSLDTRLDTAENDIDNIEENYATKTYVDTYGGKIDTISVNGVQQTITNKNVDISVPTDYVNLAGTQTISGTKTFSNGVNIEGNITDGTNNVAVSEIAKKSEIPTNTSELTNNGDGNSPFATESYVATYGGKIDSISVNGVAQTIDANKNVDLDVPTNSDYVDLTTNQDIAGVKNFTSTPTINNNNIITTNDVYINNISNETSGVDNEVVLDVSSKTLSAQLNQTISNKISRALVTPLATPSTQKLVSVDTTNSQAMVGVGDGLQVVSDTLSGKLANSTTNGLMSKEDYVTLQDVINKVENLQGTTIRLLYTDSTTPTSAQIDAFVKAQGYTDETTYGAIGVVISGTYHIWRYYENDGWQDDGVDTVSNFTSSVAGIILGSADTTANAGKVYAETDGTGSVIGWDNLNTIVTGNTNNIDSLDARVETIEDDYITSTSLSSSLNNYTTTNQLNTLLNAKQDTISDLSTIRSNASLGATAVQPATLTSTLTNYVPKSRTVNGKALSSNITLSYTDVGFTTEDVYLQEADVE